MKSKQPDTLLSEGIAWEEVIELIEDKKDEQSLKKIHPSTLKYILEENNRPQVIQALLNVLKKTDPKNATVKYAEEMINWMQTFGQIVLEQRNKKSVNK